LTGEEWGGSPANLVGRASPRATRMALMSASEPSSLFTLASIDFGDCNVWWKGESQTSGEALKIRHMGNIRQAGSCRVTLLHLTPNYVPGCWADTNTQVGQTRAPQGEPAWSRRRQVQWLPQRQLRCRRRTAGSCASPAHWLGSFRWSRIQTSLPVGELGL